VTLDVGTVETSINGVSYILSALPETELYVAVFLGNASLFFFKEVYCTENSPRYTRLQNCSFNQFAIVVIRRARHRVSTVLGMYKCNSEKQVQREKHCGSWVNLCCFIM